MKDRANKIVRTRQKEIRQQVCDFNALVKKLKLNKAVEMEILKFGIRREFQSPVAATKYYMIEVYIPELLKAILFL